MSIALWFNELNSYNTGSIISLMMPRDMFVYFDVRQVLVLDEADRILDMGFAGTLNAILGQLPKERQTLLFSATQTRSVQDLARLSLRDPEFLAVHAESGAATPARLQQTAMIVPLDEKMDLLWSFVKTHLQSKILVFLSSCKQVGYNFWCPFGICTSSFGIFWSFLAFCPPLMHFPG